MDVVSVTGMVLTTGPVNDYDRRMVLLTKERGKITVFAKGARRVGSRSMAATNPFTFGNFKLYEGKNAYNLKDVEVINYFESLRTDFEGAYLGMYFLEFADYYSRENNDEIELLKLLYQSVRAIEKESLDNRLVRAVYEMKILCVNGEFPGIPTDMDISDSCKYAINFIVNTPVEKLYTFSVNSDVLAELEKISARYLKMIVDRKFKSLELLNEFCL